MMSTIDGRIDGVALRSLGEFDDYEVTGEQLEGDAWICGRTTMQQHFADAEPFVSKTNRPAGPQPVHVAQRRESYAISVDTTGKLRWSSSDIDGDLVDEVSLLIGPGIDGRHGLPTVFDGMDASRQKAVSLRTTPSNSVKMTCFGFATK
jgi:hypothetical protein